MVTATLTSKGQITIPKAVRDSLHLQAGDRIAFEIHDGEVVFKPVTRSIDDVFGKLHDPEGPQLSVKAMNKAIGKKMKEHNG